MSYLGSEWLGGNDKRKEFIWNERMNVGIQYNRRIAQNGLNFFSLVEKKKIKSLGALLNFHGFRVSLASANSNDTGVNLEEVFHLVESHWICVDAIGNRICLKNQQA